MKCRKVLKLVCCYADLDLPQKKNLDEHLQSCPNCSREYSFHQNSMQLLKEIIHFEESEDFWRDYLVDVNASIQPTPWWKKLRTKVEPWTGLIRTPILGPVPAYVFSFVVLIILGLSLLPGFLSPQRAEAFTNSLVAYEGGLLSTVDDGGVTIYTLKGQ